MVPEKRLLISLDASGLREGVQSTIEELLFQGRHAKIVILLRVGNPLPHPLPPNAAPPANCSVLFGNLRGGGPTLSPTPTAKVPACTSLEAGQSRKEPGLMTYGVSQIDTGSFGNEGI